MFDLEELPVNGCLQPPLAYSAAHLVQKGINVIQNNGFIGQKIGVPVKDLVEEVSAIVGSQLGVPD